MIWDYIKVIVGLYITPEFCVRTVIVPDQVSFRGRRATRSHSPSRWGIKSKLFLVYPERTAGQYTDYTCTFKISTHNNPVKSVLVLIPGMAGAERLQRDHMLWVCGWGRVWPKSSHSHRWPHAAPANKRRAPSSCYIPQGSLVRKFDVLLTVQERC